MYTFAATRNRTGKYTFLSACETLVLAFVNSPALTSESLLLYPPNRHPAILAVLIES
jgi:hypothetical protein